MIASLVVYDWLIRRRKTLQLKEEWRCALTRHGEQCVTGDLITMMLAQCVFQLEDTSEVVIIIFTALPSLY